MRALLLVTFATLACACSNPSWTRTITPNAVLTARFRECLDLARRADPDLLALVQATVHIDRAGHVQSVETATFGGASAEVASCVESKILSSRFDPQEDGCTTLFLEVDFEKL